MTSRMSPWGYTVSAPTDTTPRTVWEEPNAVQVHVTLDGIEPVIWRRLVVPLATTLADLHRILQAAMGWTDSHLHEFDIGGLRYGDTDLLCAEQSDNDARAFRSGQDGQGRARGITQATEVDRVARHSLADIRPMTCCPESGRTSTSE